MTRLASASTIRAAFSSAEWLACLTSASSVPRKAAKPVSVKVFIISSPLDKAHAIPIPLRVAVLELRKGDRVGQQFPFLQAMRDVERDPVFNGPADHAK